MVLWGCPAPRGYLSVSSVPPKEHGIKGPVPQPPFGPLVAQHNHPYTSPTRGRASFPRGTGTVPQSRSQGRAPSAPRAGSPHCLCACGPDDAPRPPPAEAIRAGSALGARGASWCWGRGGWGGTSSPASGSML